MVRLPEASFASTGLPRSGDTVGNVLRVVGPIGSGGLGVVFLCDDEALGRRVAMKMLRPDRANVIERAHAFLAAARAMARVTSAHVVTIYDLGLNEGLPYFVTEHVPGVDLEEHRHDHGGKVRLDAALTLAGGILRGLESLHQLGMSHGAIGPSNVLVDPEGRVVLTDAGMAKVAVGSMRPMPSSMVRFRPEHLLRRGAPSFEDEQRFDVHATAVLLYTLITGVVPTLDPKTRTVKPPSELAEVTTRIDGPLVDVLSSPESMLLDAHALRLALERVARSRSSASETRRILIVDANESRAVATDIALAASLGDADVRRTADVAQAISLVGRVDVVLLDPDGFGPKALDVVSSLSEAANGVPIVVLTERMGPSDLGLLRGLGAKSCLYRPIDPPMLATVAESVAREWKTRRNRVP